MYGVYVCGQCANLLMWRCDNSVTQLLQRKVFFFFLQLCDKFLALMKVSIIFIQYTTLKYPDIRVWRETMFNQPCMEI